MVRFQLYTGCRPEEACTIRPQDVDCSGEVLNLPTRKPQDGTPRSNPNHHHRPTCTSKFSVPICCAPKISTASRRLIRKNNAWKNVTPNEKRQPHTGTVREPIGPSGRKEEPDLSIPPISIAASFNGLARWPRSNVGHPIGYTRYRAIRCTHRFGWFNATEKTLDH